MITPRAQDISASYTKRELVAMAKAQGFKADPGRYTYQCDNGMTFTGKDAIAMWLSVNVEEGAERDFKRQHLENHETVKQSTTVKPDKAQQLALLLGDLVNPSIDAEQVREIVKAEMKSIVVPEKTIVIDATTNERKEINGVTHEAFEKVLKLSQIRANILLVGAAGCGKTKLAEQIAEALTLPFGFLSCSAGMSESQLIGWLLPIEEGGRFAYMASRFVELYEQGGVFLLDEIDAADENLLLVLNAAFANGYLAIPQRAGNPIAKRHKDFVLIAAANTFGHGGNMVYAGRNKLDGATLDRFRSAIVPMTYDAKLEKALIDAEVLSWGLKIREQIEKLSLRRIMSTRVMLDFTKQKQMLGFKLGDFAQSYFADWTTDEKSKVGA